MRRLGPQRGPGRERPAPVPFDGHTKGRRVGVVRIALEVLVRELASLLRDRRALFSAIVLPALIYPVVFGVRSFVERLSSDAMSARPVTVAVDLEHAPEAVRSALRSRLEQEIPISLQPLAGPRASSRLEELARLAQPIHEGRPEAIEAEQELIREWLDDGVHAVLRAGPHPVLPRRLWLRVHYDGSDETSLEALARLERALDDVAGERKRELVEDVLGTADPARGLDVDPVDVATAADASGDALGRLLPLIALLVLVSGGAFAALSTFAGERENGTLETLLVQPAPPLAIAWGKLIAVACVASVALALNVGSLIASLATGIGTLPGFEGVGGDAGVAVGGRRLLVGALLFLPDALLVSAVLALVSARARSHREGQNLLLPVLLVAMVPAGLVGLLDIPFTVLTAQVPLLGPCVALRAALLGDLETAPVVIGLLAQLGWAWLVLRRTEEALDGERYLAPSATGEEIAQRHVQSRAAVRWGVVAALAVYVVGGSLQRSMGVGGLVVTLWVLLPFLTWLAVRGTARRAGESMPTALGLVAPRVSYAIGALLCAPAVALAMRGLMPLQQELLPLPTRLLTSDAGLSFLRELSPLTLFLVAALSPGICEELFFRGAVLSGLRRDLRPARAVLIQALLFGVSHASIYRFLPTTLVGLAAGAVTLRARSLVPAMVLHVTYDAVLVLSDVHPWLADPRLAFLALPGAFLLARRETEPAGMRARPA